MSASSVRSGWLRWTSNATSPRAVRSSVGPMPNSIRAEVSQPPAFRRRHGVAWAPRPRVQQQTVSLVLELLPLLGRARRSANGAARPSRPKAMDRDPVRRDCGSALPATEAVRQTLRPVAAPGWDRRLRSGKGGQERDKEKGGQERDQERDTSFQERDISGKGHVISKGTRKGTRHFTASTSRSSGAVLEPSSKRGERQVHWGRFSGEIRSGQVLGDTSRRREHVLGNASWGNASWGHVISGAHWGARLGWGRLTGERRLTGEGGSPGKEAHRGRRLTGDTSFWHVISAKQEGQSKRESKREKGKAKGTRHFGKRVSKWDMSFLSKRFLNPDLATL